MPRHNWTVLNLYVYLKGHKPFHLFFPEDFSAANDLATPKILGCFPPRSLGFLDLGVLGMALMWIMALHQLLDLLGIGSKLY